jgi:hypothetical protein
MINIYKTNIKIILDVILGKSLKSEKFAIAKMTYVEEYLEDDGTSDISSNEQFYTPFNPESGYMDDDDTIYSSKSANRKRQKNIIEEMKNIDKQYHKLARKINSKKESIEIYSTNVTPGNMIRDAITGSRYPQYRVGSSNENLFFKVRIATGETGHDGATFFFDSPEQYERHFKNSITIKQTEKEKWTNKCVDTRMKNERV